MCGIAGFFTRRELSGLSLLRTMCDRLTHRGPDADGYFFDGAGGLGHRRLSIIDLSGGHQPLGNEDGRIQVVFNGEIYNYQELRRDLIEKGHRFRTESDTEVLVHLYEEEGERMPELLNGMFAFAIWDAGRKQLFLARDRMGKKPLYYAESVPGVGFCFASELKAIAALPGFDAKVDYQSVADFLAFSYVPDPQSIYEGVRKLPPAHTLTVCDSSVRLRRYWRPSFAPCDPGLDFNEAVERIRSLASDSVERRMISDVPLGAFLSGGVDSTAVVGFMADKAPGRVKTFSIGFTDKRFDELEFARMAVERHSTEHREETVTPSVHDVLDTLVGQFDEPFGDSSAIPMLYLARMARRHVTVALCGDGADELFGGYRRYFYGVLEQRLRDKFPRWFRRSAVKLGARFYPKFDYLPQVFRAKTLLSNLSQEIGDAYFTSMATFRDAGLMSVLSDDARRNVNGYSPREAYCRRFDAVRHLAPLEQMQSVDLDTYLPGDILVKADRATMAHSLESRSPWLDYRLAEFASSLPSEWKVNGTIGKHILKRAVAPLVPEPMLARRKMGFSVPLANWFRTSLKPVFESSVLRPEMRAYVSLPEVRRIWDQHQSGLHNHDRRLWNLLMLASWDAKYGQGSDAAVLESAGARR